MIRCLAFAFSLSLIGCGAPCADDRCSLSPTTPQVQRTDYTAKSTGTTSTLTSSGGGPPGVTPAAGSAAGSAAPPPAAGSAAPPPSAGSAAPPPAAGSAAPAAGSAAPPPAKPATAAAAWALATEDPYKMTVSSIGQVPASTAIRLEFIKAPDKTPFVVTLATKAAGTSQNEAVWNDCPSTKIRCDASGTKSHATKRAGTVTIQAGINWAVTAVADDGGKTLVTWTNNLSREVLTLRLSK